MKRAVKLTPLPKEAPLEDVLNEIESQNLVYLVFGVAPSFRVDTSTSRKFLFGWNNKLEEVRFNRLHERTFTRYIGEKNGLNPQRIWGLGNPVYLDDIPVYGMFTFNTKKECEGLSSRQLSLRRYYKNVTGFWGAHHRLACI